MQEAEIFGISTAWIIANVWSVVIAIVVLVAGWVIANLDTYGASVRFEVVDGGGSGLRIFLETDVA